MMADLLLHVVCMLSVLTASPAERSAAPATATRPAVSPLGVGFLIGQGTEELLPLLEGEKDFIELMLGPDKVRFIRRLPPKARAMCVSESLDGIARAVALLKQERIPADHVCIAYNPEPRPPGTRQCTPPEELADFVASLKRARALLADYPAMLIMGPGLRQMGKQEHLYPQLARLVDAWMIQSQMLQVDMDTRIPVAPALYRERVKRIVELLRKGNPKIRIYVQIIPFKESPRVKATLTAEQVADYLRAIEDLVDAAKIYGGNTQLIRETVARLRGPAAGAQR